MRSALLAVLAVFVAATSVATAQAPVDANYFTQNTPALAPGQIEVLTRSTLPDAVTGGDVLVSVRGLEDGDILAVRRNGRAVTGAFGALEAGERTGLVKGLKNGRNRISAAVRRDGRRMVATLVVVNHPITGPVLSGPHQHPFYCETKQSGLGAPSDQDCSAATKYTWWYRTSRLGQFKQLTNPYAAYPSDMTTTVTSDGEHVPFVVRVESSTINRGVAEISVLDDPHARGPNKPFAPINWDRRVTYLFGESCGVGYHQGSTNPGVVLGGAPSSIDGSNIFASLLGLSGILARGDIIAFNTLTTFGVDCNPILSGETLMMMKEHISEQYGLVRRVIGTGGSGGALQQYNAINNYPGLLDGTLPVATFTDIPSTAMTVVDCGLLDRYYDRSKLKWSEIQRDQISGQLDVGICKDWDSEFLSNLDPVDGCSGAVPKAVRYNALKNPKGVRCTLQDATVNIWGRDPKTGFAYRPYDNVGVQYGLTPFLAGELSADRFLDLNRNIGGFDDNANPVPKRSAMDPHAAQRAYSMGIVVGRGAIAQTPVIDSATYLDLVPAADIHDVVRPFMHRARLRAYQHEDRSQSIWRGVSVPTDSYDAMQQWLDNVDHAGGDRASAVANLQPPSASDRCIVSGIGTRIDASGIFGPLGIFVPLPLGAPALHVGVPILEDQEARGVGVCQSIFTARAEPRLVAGEPLSDDVLKCTRKPVDRGDYHGLLNAAQFAELRRIFPDGVCDYSRPGVGEVSQSMVWPSLGANKLQTPHALQWRVARSAPLP